MPTPLSLPEPRNEPLVNSPLGLVVCQVRHQGGAPVGETEVERIYEFVKTDFPTVEPKLGSTVNIAAGSEGVATQQTAPRHRWQFRSEDGWTAVLGQTQFALETINYDRWDKFVGHFGLLMRAVADICKPVTEERVGLRFVNRFQLDSVTTPEHFQDHMTDETLGLLVDGKLSSSIISTQNCVDLQGPNDIILRLQHGYPSIGNAVSYIVDTDCYKQLSVEFSTQNILQKIESFHRLCKQIFEAVITKQLYDTLRR